MSYDIASSSIRFLHQVASHDDVKVLIYDFGKLGGDTMQLQVVDEMLSTDPKKSGQSRDILGPLCGQHLLQEPLLNVSSRTAWSSRADYRHWLYMKNICVIAKRILQSKAAHSFLETDILI